MLPIMRCGCRAQGRKPDGSPICAVHLSATIAPEQPELEARQARCDCGRKDSSAKHLAFFQYLPGEAFDRYYCGHAGWD